MPVSTLSTTGVGKTPIVLYDTMIGADSTAISSHIPDIVPSGSSWSQTNVNSFYIQSSGLQPNRKTDGDLATINIGVSDFIYSATVTPVNNTTNLGYPGLVFRYSDTSNFWYLFPDSGSNQRIQLYTVIAGAHTERVRYPYALTSGVPVALRVECFGPNVTIFADGIEICTFVSTHNQTAKNVGVRYGQSLSPTGRCIWDNLRIVPFTGLSINWPIFTKSGSNPVIPLGAGGTWDDKDINNPNVVWDAVNNRYFCYYSGYPGDATNIQHMGLAYSSTLPGTWTKDAGNPVFSSNGTDGIYAMNGGIVKKGSTWYHYYVSNSGTKIRVATASDPAGPWTRIGIAIDVGAAATWDVSSVFDPHARLREDGVTIEVWYAASNGSTRGIGYATSTDGTTFTKYANNPVFSGPPGLSLSSVTFGEPSVFVPVGKEGSEMLVSFDTALSASPNNRFISQAATVDGGVTWHYRIAALEKGTGWESQQVIDSFIVVDNGTMYMYYGGANTAGAALDLNIQIGVGSVSWPYTSLRAN